ncbi:MAG: hypothetical protein QXM68_04315 [Candidatus Aenigmatarchaeota archaeon]|nr:hypothetical protein [Candidatus Aenigmarchaeota archaeon]
MESLVKGYQNYEVIGRYKINIEAYRGYGVFKNNVSVYLIIKPNNIFGIFKRTELSGMYDVRLLKEIPRYLCERLKGDYPIEEIKNIIADAINALNT